MPLDFCFSSDLRQTPTNDSTLTFNTVKETLLALSAWETTLRQKEEPRLVCVITKWSSPNSERVGGGSANGKVSSQRRLFFLPWDCFNQALPLLNNTFDSSWLVGLILHSVEPTWIIKPCVNIKSRILATLFVFLAHTCANRSNRRRRRPLPSVQPTPLTPSLHQMVVRC